MPRPEVVGTTIPFCNTFLEIQALPTSVPVAFCLEAGKECLYYYSGTTWKRVAGRVCSVAGGTPLDMTNGILTIDLSAYAQLTDIVGKASMSYVDSAIASLVDSAPGALNTLREIDNALGNDPNLAATLTAAIATKEPAIAAGTTGQFWRGDKSWQALPAAIITSVFGRTGTVAAVSGDYNTSQVTESGNLYFTVARALASALTGFSANNAVIVATDTILAAFGKAQGQINALLTAVGLKVDKTTTVNGHALSGSVTVTQADLGIQGVAVEIDLGATPKRSGAFTVAGFTGLVAQPIAVQQAAGPYTGKGTRADEAEMDGISVAASVLNSTTIQAFWNTPGFVAGKFKFYARAGV